MRLTALGVQKLYSPPPVESDAGGITGIKMSKKRMSIYLLIKNPERRVVLGDRCFITPRPGVYVPLGRAPPNAAEFSAPRPPVFWVDEPLDQNESFWNRFSRGRRSWGIGIHTAHVSAAETRAARRGAGRGGRWVGSSGVKSIPPCSPKSGFRISGHGPTLVQG